MRLYRFFRQHPVLPKWCGGLLASVLIIASSVSSGWFGNVGIALFFLFVIFPMVLLLLVQLAFWTYHWIAHGDPLYEPRDHVEGGFFAHGEVPGPLKKRQKKLCPICKRHTRCKVYDGRKGGVPYHIMRG